MVDKVIISNRSALLGKYGKLGFDNIQVSLKSLIEADAKRGLKTNIIYVDAASAMKSVGGKAVTDAGDCKQNKDAADAIFRKLSPQYLMILGSIDIVPHQDLKSPTFDPPNDGDRASWGDLPYACDAPYSRDVTKFKGATRVVGRLPDLTKATNPSYLLKLLKFATDYKSRPVTDYANYFGLSTHSWRKSSEQSLQNVFGNSGSLILSPPAGQTHSAKRLAPLSHFINCHGSQSDPAFYGEKGTSQPKSLRSEKLAGKIKQGVVASVECCFGAELYDSVTLAKPIPICQQYLALGAYGYFGSTTIAYGPAEGNGAADLITQYFLLEIQHGASIGEAALLARQQFVRQTNELDPVDLKTLAQFNLLGDPSVKPALVPSATVVPKGINRGESDRQARKMRRAKVKAEGELLENTKPVAQRKAKNQRISVSVKAALANIAKEAGYGKKMHFTAYNVTTPKASALAKSKAVPAASRYFVSIYRPATGQKSVAAVARETSGGIIAYRIYQEK